MHLISLIERFIGMPRRIRLASRPALGVERSNQPAL
jgi:hypothetical protein